MNKASIEIHEFAIVPRISPLSKFASSLLKIRPLSNARARPRRGEIAQRLHAKSVWHYLNEKSERSLNFSSPRMPWLWHPKIVYGALLTVTKIPKIRRRRRRRRRRTYLRTHKSKRLNFQNILLETDHDLTWEDGSGRFLRLSGSHTDESVLSPQIHDFPAASLNGRTRTTPLKPPDGSGHTSKRSFVLLAGAKKWRKNGSPLHGDFWTLWSIREFLYVFHVCSFFSNLIKHKITFSRQKSCCN